MAEAPVRVLLIEDNPSDADLIAEALAEVGASREGGPRFELVTAERLAAGLARLAQGGIGVVLLDLSLPDSHGFQTFASVRAQAPATPIVLLSGLDDAALAARAVREGAQDYLVKGQVDGNLLGRALLYAIERKRAEQEREQLIREQAARAQAEEAQHRLAFLAEASRQLVGSLDYEATLPSVARLAVPTLADWCAIDLLEEGRTIRRLALAHADPAQEPLARELSHPPAAGGSEPIWRALTSGQAQLVPVIADPLLEATARDAEQLRPLRALGLTSAIVVPLVARGRTLGAISLAAAGSGRRYTPSDLALAEDLAGRVALAVDNALLYRQVQAEVRTRDEFLAAASHDLKNPLVAIRGSAQLLQRAALRGGAVDPERLTAGLERIDEAVVKMTKLIDELLDITRLQMGQPLELELERADLVALAERVAAEHRPTAARHRIVVDSAERQLVGEWDARRLERVLDNLLANAIKYSPAGGTITVRVRRQEGADRPSAVLQIQDQGLGIPAADLPRVFERFQRAGNVVGRIRGTGIGLASARQIVEQHGGRISVQSREGEGSTFTVRLPLSPRPSLAPV